MARTRLTLSLNAQHMLESIRRANGDVDAAARGATQAGADAYESALIAACQNANVPHSVTNHIQKEVTRSGNKYTAVVGWRLQNYDPTNPSEGFNAIFLNYGTPRRTTTNGANRGAIVGRGFIGKAKRMSKSSIKQAQEDFLSNILRGLR